MAGISAVKGIGIVLGILMIFILVQPVGAYYTSFNDNTTGWVGESPGGISRVLIPGETDIYCGYTSGGGYAYYNYGAAMTSGAFTILPGSSSYGIRFFDGGAHAIPLTPYGTGRYYWEYSGSVVNIYRDGVFVVNHSLSSAPTRFGPYGGITYFDDYAINEGSGVDAIGGPPSTWFLGKDLNNPTVYGIYDGTYTLKNNLEFHYSSGNQTGASGVQEYHFGVPSGPVTITEGGASQTIRYSNVISAGTSIAFDKDSYAVGETAITTWNISSTYWLPGELDYKVRIFRGDDLVNNKGEAIVSTQNGTASFSTATFTTGYTYVAELMAFPKSSPATGYYLAYDTASFLSGIRIYGYVYDAWNGTGISGAGVYGVQGSTTEGNLTSAGAYYELSTFNTGINITVSAGKSGYLNQSTTFTPLAGVYLFNVTFGLAPGVGTPPAGPGNWTPGGGCPTCDNGDSGHTDTGDGTHSPEPTPHYNNTTDGTAVGGMVYKAPYSSIADGATVTITNGSWSNTDTVNSAGWYQINNIPAAGSYTVTASLSGYENSSDTFTVYVNEFNRKDFYLGVDSGLTVKVRNSETSAPISGATVELSDGTSGTTGSTGNVNFANLTYGVYEISAAAAGYYPGSSSVVVDSPSESVTINLVSTTPGGSGGSGMILSWDNSSTVNVDINGSGQTGYGVGYPPHDVKFHVQDLWGIGIPDVSVTAQGISTTTGSWDWLALVMGMNLSAAPIHNTSLSGTTDSDGDITFLMVPSIKYCMTFSKTGYTFDSPWYVQPKDEYYVIFSQGNATFFNNTAGYDFFDVFNASVTTNPINATHTWINVSYTDNLTQTTAINVTLNQSHPENATWNETNLAYNTTIPSGINITYPFLVTPYHGLQYKIHIRATHTTFSAVAWDFGIAFPRDRAPGGIPVQMQIWAALGIIIFTALLAGATSNIQISFLCCLEGWFFFAIGWLADLGPGAAMFLTFATLVSIFAILMARKNKERFA